MYWGKNSSHKNIVYVLHQYYLKGLHKTTPNRLGALTSTQCTRTLCLPPTTFCCSGCRINFISLLWQAHKQQHDFGPEIMNNKIYHLKGLQRTTPNRPFALTSSQCTRTLCLSLTTILSMWLRNKIHYAFMAGIQKEQDF